MSCLKSGNPFGSCCVCTGKNITANIIGAYTSDICGAIANVYSWVQGQASNFLNNSLYAMGTTTWATFTAFAQTIPGSITVIPFVGEGAGDPPGFNTSGYEGSTSTFGGTSAYVVLQAFQCTGTVLFSNNIGVTCDVAGEIDIFCRPEVSSNCLNPNFTNIYYIGLPAISLCPDYLTTSGGITSVQVQYGMAMNPNCEGTPCFAGGFTSLGLCNCDSYPNDPFDLFSDYP